MITYHKIETLFDRDEKFNITGKLRNPVIGTISQWIVTEKIDGTNIRVTLTKDDQVLFGGRTDNAQIPADLIKYLIDTFTVDKMKNLRTTDELVEITLFGEGYGAGIQKGGGDYRSDKGFILFDVLINDKYWLVDDAVTEIANKLNILRVPILGIMTLNQIKSLVEKGFDSRVSINKRLAEGIVARPITPLFDHRRNRLVIKLKTKDFVHH